MTKTSSPQICESFTLRGKRCTRKAIDKHRCKQHLKKLLARPRYYLSLNTKDSKSERNKGKLIDEILSHKGITYDGDGYFIGGHFESDMYFNLKNKKDIATIQNILVNYPEWTYTRTTDTWNDYVVV